MAIGQEERHRGMDAKVTEGWPDVIWVKVWLISEDDHYAALAEDFNIAGQGRSEGAALNDMAELMRGYFDSAIEEGLTLEQARRPIPARDRVGLRLRRLASVPARWLHQSAAREGTFILPRLFDGEPHAC